MQLGCTNLSIEKYMISLQAEIERILSESHEPLSVPDLIALFKKLGRTPHKTSIYRNLEKMIAEESVEEVLLGAGVVYYEYKGLHHHHAQCNTCSAVVCIANDLLEKGMEHLERAAKKSGFIPSEHHVILRGTCTACQGA